MILLGKKGVFPTVLVCAPAQHICSLLCSTASHSVESGLVLPSGNSVFSILSVSPLPYIFIFPIKDQI